LTRGYCDGCKWDTWIPPGFGVREEYRRDPAWGHLNATRRPPLGVEFLDRAIAPLTDMLAMCKRRPRL